VPGERPCYNGAMELRIMTEPQQGATYDELAAMARATEEAGLDGFFRSDHYLAIGRQHSARAAVGPTDAWVTLGAIARETSRIRLGTMLTAGTFRLPGPLAITVAQVDQMSGGRIELGLGAGWYEAEHLAYGIPFPPTLKERRERLVEQLEVITGLWAATEERPFSFEGRHYRLEESPGLPKPLQRPRPPIIIGGKGTRLMPRVAARFADECNVSFDTVETLDVVGRALDEACAEQGRDPSSIVRSVALTTVCGEDRAAATRRAEAIGRELDDVGLKGAAGTPGEIAERLAEYRAVGVTRVYLQLLDVTDLEQIALIGAELLPLVGAL
jgi:F420-dependent oxidoreductase-like protein